MIRKNRNRVYKKKRKRFIGKREIHRRQNATCFSHTRCVSFDPLRFPAPSVSYVFVLRIHSAPTLRVLGFMLLKLTEPQAKAVRLKVGIPHPRAQTASACTPFSFDSLHSPFLAQEI